MITNRWPDITYTITDYKYWWYCRSSGLTYYTLRKDMQREIAIQTNLKTLKFLKKHKQRFWQVFWYAETKYPLYLGSTLLSVWGVNHLNFLPHCNSKWYSLVLLWSDLFIIYTPGSDTHDLHYSCSNHWLSKTLLAKDCKVNSLGIIYYCESLPFPYWFNSGMPCLYCKPLTGIP